MSRIIMLVLWSVVFVLESVVAALTLDLYITPVIDKDFYMACIWLVVWIIAVMFILGLTIGKIVLIYQHKMVVVSIKHELYKNMLEQPDSLSTLHNKTKKGGR